MPEPILKARVVRTRRGTLKLHTECGCYTLDFALPTTDLEENDIVALVVLQRNAPLPLLDLPLQHGYPYGSPIPVHYEAKSQAPDALRHGPLPEEAEAEPVA